MRFVSPSGRGNAAMTSQRADAGGHLHERDSDGTTTVGARPSGPPDPERLRLREAATRRAPWKRWGPYLAGRQWGTVREDYSVDADPWRYFPHDQARLRAYRWGEDGLLGVCDSNGFLCFAVALWNETDPVLKERLFGLTGDEGNHGEDVKEEFFFLDSTPTHSYMKALYKYPQRAFPYEQLVQENARRGRDDPEYELLDTGIFDEERYFDILVEYAKSAPDDIFIRITATNRGPDPAPLHLLPHLWFRNTWSWGQPTPGGIRPILRAEPPTAPDIVPPGTEVRRLSAEHPMLGRYWLACHGTPDVLLTENERTTPVITAAKSRRLPRARWTTIRSIVLKPATPVPPPGTA